VVTGLEKENFSLYQDKVQQAITHFASEDAPTSIGIVFDTSESMAPKLSKAREAVNALMTNTHPDDEFFLVAFNSESALLVPMTSQHEEIRSRVAALTTSGGTALLDAVGLAMSEMRNARYARKALIIISDGEDNASHRTVHDLKQEVGRGDVLIYAIGITDSTYSSMTWPPSPSTGLSLLGEITSETGGRLFEVHNLKELPKIASRISAWLRSQYVLGYAPGSSGDNRRYHRIQLRLTKPNGFPRLHALWRLGYYAPTE
jgi:VWFA-related protein